MKHLVTAAVAAMTAGAYVLVPAPAGQHEIRMDTAAYDLPTLPSSAPATLPAKSASTTAAADPEPAESGPIEVPDPDDIPQDAVLAYQRAAQILTEVSPRCDLPWTLLAAIGGVESDHGRHPGSSEESGATPQAPVRVSTAGGLEPIGADGPMQISPALWDVVGVDGDGDGVRSRRDLDDAALAAGVYLCAGWEGLDKPGAAAEALLGYRDSERFVDTALAYERAYDAADYADVADLKPTAHSGLPDLSGVPVPGVGVPAAGADKEDDAKAGAKGKADGRGKRGPTPGERATERAVKQSKKAVKDAAGWRKPWSSATRDADPTPDGAKGADKAGTKAGSKKSTQPGGKAQPAAPAKTPAASKSPKPGAEKSPATPGSTPATPSDTPKATPSPGTTEGGKPPAKTPSPTPSCPQQGAPGSPTTAPGTGTSDSTSADAEATASSSASGSPSGDPSGPITEGVRGPEDEATSPSGAGDTATSNPTPSGCGTPTP